MTSENLSAAERLLALLSRAAVAAIGVIALAQISFPTSAAAAAVQACVDGTTGVPSGSVVLRGEYLCIGLGIGGTMGVGGSINPGIRHSPTGDVANKGSYDYLTPGAPYDGFALQADNVNGGVFLSNSNGSSNSFTGTLTDTSAGSVNSATWVSTSHASYDITNVYSFNDADQTLKVSVTITAKEDIVNLRYLRSMDPDAMASSGDSNETRNALGFGDLPASDFVYTEALDSKVVLSMYSGSAVPHEAKLFNDCCSIVSPNTPSYATSGTGDWGIGIAFYIGDLLTGNSVVLDYEYRFAASLEEAVGGGRDPSKPDIGVSRPEGYTIGDVNSGAVNPIFDGGTLLFSDSGTIGANFQVTGNNGTINSGDNTVLFAGNFSGPGQMTLTGNGTASLSGNNTNTGGFNVQGGTLDLQTGGAISGNVNVGAGANFVGNGTVGGTTTADGHDARLSGAGTFNGDVIIRNGAIHAPGNSPGTVTINANYILEPAGTLEVELASDGTSDVLNVNGTATLNGRLQVLGYGTGFVAPTYSYTVLNNDLADAIIGDFASYRNDFAFYTVSYSLTAGTGNDVSITLTRNGNTFTDIAQAPNERETASALDSLPTADYASVIGLLTPAETRALLNSLSGEVHASAVSMLSDDLARSLADRTTGDFSPFSGQCGFTTNGRDLDDAERANCVLANSVKVLATGGVRIVEDGNVGRTTVSQGVLEAQLLFPFEMSNGAHAYVGTILNHGNGWIDVGTPGSNARTTTNGLGVVAGWQQGGLEVTGALGFNWANVDASRSIAGTAASAAFDVSTLGASLGVSYAMELENGMTVRPYGALTHAAATNSAIAETTTSGLAYSAAAGTSHQTLATLGLELTSEFEMEDYVVRPRADVSITQRVAGGPAGLNGTIGNSTAFTTLGANSGDTVLGVGLGATIVKAGGLSFDLDYNFQASGSSTSHSAKVSMKVQF